MIKLLEIREYLRRFYSKYELYIVPAGKFIIALLVFLLINGNLGYMEKIAKVPLMFVLALACSFLPVSFILFFAAALILLHTYALSMEVAAVVGIVFVLIFLLYLRMSPKEVLITMLTPVAFALHIPYILPITIGLVGSPASVFSVGSGIVIYYTLNAVTQMSNAIDSLDSEKTASKFRFIIDGIIQNKTMMVMIVAFAATIIVVYFVHRMNIDHAWTVATIVGALTNALIVLVGDLMFVTRASLFGVLGGTVLAIGVVYVLKFFMFNLDYARTERVQFEDDEYYYYVKAVPKITLQETNKTVKKVSAKAPVSDKSKSGGIKAEKTAEKAAEQTTERRVKKESSLAGAASAVKSNSSAAKKSAGASAHKSTSASGSYDSFSANDALLGETRVVAEKSVDEGRVVKKAANPAASASQSASNAGAARSTSNSRIAGDLACRRNQGQTRVRNDGYAGPNPSVGMTNGETIAERIRRERLKEAESIDADRLRRQNSD